MVDDQPFFDQMNIAVERIDNATGHEVDIFEFLIPFQESFDRECKNYAQNKPWAKRYQYYTFEYGSKGIKHIEKLYNARGCIARFIKR